MPYKARAFVVGPSNSSAYGPADLTAFQDLLRTSRSASLKVIGVGAGATFVNSVIATHAFAVAGILTPGRVYFTGLSAGAMNSFTYGVNNLKRIAGVAGHSAPFGPPQLLDAATEARTSGQHLPMYAIAGNRDMYRPLPVNQTPRSFYNVIRAFALLNDITVPASPDLAVNEMVGLKLGGPAGANWPAAAPWPGPSRTARE